MEETAYMEEALNLARMGLGYTSPNPTVGCVIVKDGACRKKRILYVATGKPCESYS